MSDRIAVMRGGTIAGVLSRAKTRPRSACSRWRWGIDMLSQHRRELWVAHRDWRALRRAGDRAPGIFRTRQSRSTCSWRISPVLIIAAGMTLVMLAGEIDISVGSAFAVCAVSRRRAREGGRADRCWCSRRCARSARSLGALNGSLVAYLRLPSIVVTLAMMIVLRDALRWITQGAWVQDLPAGFSVDGVVAGRVSVRRRAARRGDRRGACVGPAVHGGRPAVLRHRIEPRRGASRRRQHVARDAVRVRVARRADRPRRGAERDAIQPDSRQHRARTRAEGDRRGRGRRHRDYGRTRHAGRARCSAWCCSARSGRR